MKKNQSVSNALTAEEKRLLNICIRMDDWGFKEMIANRCLLVSREIIGWEKGDDGYETEPVCVYIYGLIGVNKETGARRIYNFFIQYEFKVYQTWEIDKAVAIQSLITKEYLMEKQREKERIARIKKRKLISIKAA